MILVDSSALIPFLRGDKSVAARFLAVLEEEGIQYAIPLICAQEVLQGAGSSREWKTLESYLSTQHLAAPTDPLSAHFAAARIYYDCRRRGYTVRSTVDCLIAQLALELQADLLQDDRDFAAIAKVRPLKFAGL